MVYTKVNPGDVIDIKDAAGVPHEGVYKGCKEVSTNLGTQYIYKFETENGKLFGIWGFTTLNTFMENIPMGMQCRVIYTGQTEEKNKYGKHLHLCTVEIDEESANTKIAPSTKSLNDAVMEQTRKAGKEQRFDFKVEFTNLPKKTFSAVMELCKKKMGEADFKSWFKDNGYPAIDKIKHPDQKATVAKELKAICENREFVAETFGSQNVDDIDEPEIPF